MADSESLISGETLPRVQADVAPLAALPTGDARYEPIGTLGEGGMGRVVEAVDKQFSRVVAIKELRSSSGDAGRLLTEALVTGNLEHPGVPAVYERGLRADGAPYYVMRRVRGRALEDVLLEARDLSARLSFLPALTRAAQTLGFAHEKGVVHRDVKPQNIMVGSHGEVFVVDWGLARAGSLSSGSSSGSHSSAGEKSSSNAQLTQQGQVLGTPAYMAPEQARGDGAMVDARTDVFALGAVLYRVLAGRPPYEGSSVSDVLALARRAEMPNIDVLAPDAPGPLRDICKKAMALSASERFPTAQHLADALEGFASTAVTRAWERPAGRAVWISMVFAVFATLFGLSGLARVSQHGELWNLATFFSIAFTVCSFTLAWFEWRGRGRLRLAPLGYGAAFTCFLSGWIGVGFSFLMLPIEEAMRQSAAAVGVGSLFCAISLGVWGVVMRDRR